MPRNGRGSPLALTALALAAGSIVFFAGVAGVLLTAASTWLDRHPWPYWLLSLTLIAFIVAAALDLSLGPRAKPAARVALGSLSFASLLLVLIVGTFVPYWGSWGDLDIRELEGDSDLAWRTLLLYLLVAASVSGVFLGALVGFVSWRWRLLRFRRHLS